MPLLPIMLMAQQTADAPSVESALADYREKTEVAVHCRLPKDPNEIVVCSRRGADRYRVPFVLSYNPADTTAARVTRALDTHPPQCGQTAFMFHCGSVGVSVKVDAGGLHYVERERAP